MKRGSGWYVGTTKTGRRVLAAAGTKSARDVKKQPGTRWYATRGEAEKANNPRKGRRKNYGPYKVESSMVDPTHPYKVRTGCGHIVIRRMRESTAGVPYSPSVVIDAPGGRPCETCEKGKCKTNPRKGSKKRYSIRKAGGGYYRMERFGREVAGIGYVPGMVGLYPSKKAAEAAAHGRAISFAKNPKGSNTHRIALNNPLSIKQAIERAAKAVKSGGRVVVRMLRTSKRNPFEAGLSRAWYNKGKKAGHSRRYSDMYDAWAVAKKKASKIPGQYVTQQESFYQGYIDTQ